MFVLSTGSLHNYSIARVFALAREVGFDGIEVIVDLRWDTRQVDYLRSLSTAYDLPILSVHSPFITGIDGWEDDPIQSVQRSVQLAQAVGAHVVVAHLPYRWHWLMLSTSLLEPRYLFPLPVPRGQAYAQWLLNGMHHAGDADSVQIAVENMPARRTLGFRWNPYRFNSPQQLSCFVALVLDTTHLGTWGLDVVEVYERLKSRIVHVHLSDYDGREHRLPGHGRLRLAELLRRMAADGYKGLIVVETGPQALGAGDDEQVQRRLGEGLSFCRAHFQVN